MCGLASPRSEGAIELRHAPNAEMADADLLGAAELGDHDALLKALADGANGADDGGADADSAASACCSAISAISATL